VNVWKEGMSLRAYFMAHAPVEPQPWFNPKITEKHFGSEIEKQRYVQWPAAWADEQITIIGNMI
jgi:hypothetical protein